MTSSSDLACSILVLVAENTRASSFISVLRDDVVSEEATCIPWTIVNKYYTADVQFLVRELSSWTPDEEELNKIPAVLFLWSGGQQYRETAQRLSQQLSAHDFEVVLAVRSAPQNVSLVSDLEDIDAHLASLGFEFVDVMDANEGSSSGRDDILGVHRVVDALSTVMWPSMVRKAMQRDMRQSLFDMIHRGQSTVFDADDVASLLEKSSSRVHQRLEEFEHWLEGERTGMWFTSRDDNATDPWSTVVTPGNVTPQALSDADSGSRPSTPKPGFDDDFSSFVSSCPSSSSNIAADSTASQESSSTQSHCIEGAPAVSTSFGSTFDFDSTCSDLITPTLDESDRSMPNTCESTPAASFDTSLSYSLLDSVSDLGDLDTDMSSTEIEKTSRRIFGSESLTVSPTALRSSTRDPQSEHAALRQTPLSAEAFKEVDKEYSETDDVAGLERFDLQNVLSTLQGLKEEIATIPDGEARHRAAARVALGLVYGLDPSGK